MKENGAKLAKLDCISMLTITAAYIGARLMAKICSMETITIH